MGALDLDAAGRFVRALPERFRGPGGVAGIVKDGRVVLKHAWGYADLGRRLPMTEATPLPICSISKHFTCAVLLDLVGDPARLDGRVTDHLPNLEGPHPSIAQLCHNQSGLRDYWALTVLHGADAEGRFRRVDAAPLFARMRRTHFPPGLLYSYSNGNFRILSDIVEAQAGRSLGELYESRIFARAGMETMRFTPDTAAPAGGVVGYEGNGTVGFFPAANRIFWTGDAGLSASLDDMLAWECFIDRTRDDADGLYRRLAAPTRFADGTPARYGFGLGHERIGDVAVTGHGGALRGFRCQRLHAAAARLSVVVMFNHEHDARGAASAIMKAALALPEAAAGPAGRSDPAWNGDYLEPQSGLLLTVRARGPRLDAHFGTLAERLAPDGDDVARAGGMTLTRQGAMIAIDRPGENFRGQAGRVGGAPRPDIGGRYHCAELDATLEIVMAGDDVGYVACSGFLGDGPMHPIHAVGEDVWIMPCRRSMDAPAPGRWTIHVTRGADGAASGLRIGCWLARDLRYARLA